MKVEIWLKSLQPSLNYKLWNLLCMCVQSLSHVRLFATPWTIAHQAPLFMGFSKQEHWSRLPFPTPGDLPSLGIKSASLASHAEAGRFSTAGPPGLLGHKKEQNWVSWNTVLIDGPRVSHGEGNGNPLQCSCLENPKDGGAWWAAIWGRTESDTTEVT